MGEDGAPRREPQLLHLRALQKVTTHNALSAQRSVESDIVESLREHATNPSLNRRVFITLQMYILSNSPTPARCTKVSNVPPLRFNRGHTWHCVGSVEALLVGSEDGKKGTTYTGLKHFA